MRSRKCWHRWACHWACASMKAATLFQARPAFCRRLCFQALAIATMMRMRKTKTSTPICWRRRKSRKTSRELYRTVVQPNVKESHSERSVASEESREVGQYDCCHYYLDSSLRSRM